MAISRLSSAWKRHLQARELLTEIAAGVKRVVFNPNTAHY